MGRMQRKRRKKRHKRQVKREETERGSIETAVTSAGEEAPYYKPEEGDLVVDIRNPLEGEGTVINTSVTGRNAVVLWAGSAESTPVMVEHLRRSGHMALRAPRMATAVLDELDVQTEPPPPAEPPLAVGDTIVHAISPGFGLGEIGSIEGSFARISWHSPYRGDTTNSIANLRRAETKGGIIIPPTASSEVRNKEWSQEEERFECDNACGEVPCGDNLCGDPERGEYVKAEPAFKRMGAYLIPVDNIKLSPGDDVTHTHHSAFGMGEVIGEASPDEYVVSWANMGAHKTHHIDKLNPVLASEEKDPNPNKAFKRHKMIQAYKMPRQLINLDEDAQVEHSPYPPCFRCGMPVEGDGVYDDVFDPTRGMPTAMLFCQDCYSFNTAERELRARASEEENNQRLREEAHDAVEEVLGREVEEGDQGRRQEARVAFEEILGREVEVEEVEGLGLEKRAIEHLCQRKGVDWNIDYVDMTKAEALIHIKQLKTMPDVGFANSPEEEPEGTNAPMLMGQKIAIESLCRRKGVNYEINYAGMSQEGALQIIKQLDALPNPDDGETLMTVAQKMLVESLCERKNVTVQLEGNMTSEKALKLIDELDRLPNIEI